MRQSALHTLYGILLKEMTVPVDARLHNQGQVMLLNVILLSYFSNSKAEYNSICGKLCGYQKGGPGGFHPSKTIDQSYFEGTSIAAVC